MSKFCVSKIVVLNNAVDRLYSEDEAYILDVPSQLFHCKIGDTLTMKCQDKPVKTCAYVLNGSVYHSTDNSACISCGGLLVHVPSSMLVGTNTYINVSKCKKGLTNERSEESKPRTRQRQ